MSSVFETLPDEILMIILRYSGDVFTIFRTFHGLNQRLNNILIDHRFHLFADFLHIDARDVTLDCYYNSAVFQNVSQQLSSMKTTANAKQLRQYLELLMVFHVRETYTRLERQLQSYMENIQSVRKYLTNDMILDLDKQVKAAFNDLHKNSTTISSMKRIESLLFTKGARLECDEYEMGTFNLATALNQLLQCHFNRVRSVTRSFADSMIEMFKVFISSNPHLLNDAYYGPNLGNTVYYFLLYPVYQSRYFDRYTSSAWTCIDMECYRVMVNLLLFSIQCQKHVLHEEGWVQKSVPLLLNLFSSSEPMTDNEIFVQTSQLEILKIVLDEYGLQPPIPWDERDIFMFKQTVGDVIKKDRIDVILLTYRQSELVRDFLNKYSDSRKNVDMMTENKAGRQLFEMLLDEKPLGLWLTNKDLLFILLQKKERKLIEKLLKSSSSLVTQLDDDGNNPLLYVCLKVHGCRHRIVESLFKMGCNPLTRNLNGENFIDAIQLWRNRKLLENLVERKVIKIDRLSGMIEVTLIDQLIHE